MNDFLTLGANATEIIGFWVAAIISAYRYRGQLRSAALAIGAFSLGLVAGYFRMIQNGVVEPLWALAQPGRRGGLGRIDQLGGILGDLGVIMQVALTPGYYLQT